MNLTAIEDWLEHFQLPRGIHTHFAPVRDLLNWLQVCGYLGFGKTLTRSNLSVIRPFLSFRNSSPKFKP